MSSKEDADLTTNFSRTANFSIILLKVIELALIIICIGLIDDPVNNQMNLSKFGMMSIRTISLCYATFGAFLIYTAVLLAMKLVGESQSWKTSSTWSFIGFVLFLVCAIVLLRDWSISKDRNYWHPNTTRLDFICSVGSISLIASIVYLIDLIITARFGIRGEIE